MHADPNRHLGEGGVDMPRLKGRGSRADEVLSGSGGRDDERQMIPFRGRRPQRITERTTDLRGLEQCRREGAVFKNRRRKCFYFKAPKSEQM